MKGSDITYSSQDVICDHSHANILQEVLAEIVDEEMELKVALQVQR